MGVCIETKTLRHSVNALTVTPYMGVCIETPMSLFFRFAKASHTLYGCVY